MKPLGQRKVWCVAQAVLIGIFTSIASGEILSAPQAFRSIPAFPGAEGFGANSVGGHGGKVIEVTKVSDSGRGSFRAAIEAEGPRIVVFRVGGTIELLSRIDIKNPYITIAGQTAPGGGITLKNDPSNIKAPIQIETHDVIIRYIRSRPGPGAKKSGSLRALTILGGNNIIIDHCSFSWATDEILSTWEEAKDITIQWNIIAEALDKSTHLKGPHSKGMLLGSQGAGRISLHHNLFAHNRKRNPDVNVSDVVDIVNNVIYNFRRGVLVKDSYAKPKVNYIGNYAKHGSDNYYDFDIEYWKDQNIPPELYVRGNISFNRPTNDLAEYLVVREQDRQHLIANMHTTPAVTTTSALKAYEQVLMNAGATRPMRDPVDQRIVNDVINGTGKVIDNPAEVGGWPELLSGTPPTDTDHDGMPDYWEHIKGLNKKDPSDGPVDANGNGYTNLEEYLNAIAG